MVEPESDINKLFRWVRAVHELGPGLKGGTWGTRSGSGKTSTN